MPFKKGQSVNPGGKPKSEYRKMLDLAMKAKTKEHKMSLIEHAVEQAYSDNTVLTAILRKLLPDLRAVDANITQDSPFRLIIDLSPKSKPDTK
jgi:hypothetical protein